MFLPFHTKTSITKYGIFHEKDDIIYLEENLKMKIHPCGLFVSEHLPYLGATPDGIIYEDGIVEIKCQSSCQQLSPEEAIISRKFNFWILRNKLIFPINSKHKYYFQVQCQLHLGTIVCLYYGHLNV